MSPYPTKCPHCGKQVTNWDVLHRCGKSLGFPNRRAAEAEGGELLARYVAIRTEAAKRGVLNLVDKLEAIAEKSAPVIAMPFAVCDDILRSKKYRNYEQLLTNKDRPPAADTHHSDRRIVAERIYPTYSEQIHYAALSPSGRGLPSYGPLAVRWLVVPEYLEPRISLLEENSFTFYDRYGMGRLGANVPAGFRAIWENRTKLTASKLASRLTMSTSVDRLAEMIIHAGATRQDDDFVEIAIYSDDGVDSLDVDKVTIQRRPKNREEEYRWELVKDMCEQHIPVIEVVE